MSCSRPVAPRHRLQPETQRPNPRTSTTGSGEQDYAQHQTTGSASSDINAGGGLRLRWRAATVGLAVVAALVGSAVDASAHAQLDPIEIENAQSGTSDWELTNPATDREIEGYASLPSVAKGGTIDLYVNTASSTYSLEVFRTGWYDGDGARRLFGPVHVTGTNQGPVPSPDATTGIVEANWINPYSLNVGPDWTTGVYLARLTENSGGNQSYIIFVVRDDRRAADLLLQLPVATYQAYNFWGGKSAYDVGSCNPDDPHDPAPCDFPWGTDQGAQAVKTSFDRPYAASTYAAASRGMGAGEYLTNVQPVAESYPISSDGWDYNTVRFLEREGYDVTYITDLDTHVASVGDLTKHGAILAVGHDEYWSWEMRENVEDAIAAGTDVAFMGGNIAYWQVRFEPSTVSGAPNRTMVTYKNNEADPYWSDGDPSNDHLITDLFRNPPIDRPEDAMIGIRYVNDPFDHDITVADASHWAFDGTGLVNGDKLVGLLGYEVDTIAEGSPANIQILGESPVRRIDDVAGWRIAAALIAALLALPVVLLAGWLIRKVLGLFPGVGPGGTRFAQRMVQAAVVIVATTFVFVALNLGPFADPIDTAHMTMYEAPSGALVFATGSMQWSWGLDDYNAPDLRPSVLSADAQRITRNILDRFINSSGPP